jgi:dihydrofolate reductase
MRKLSVFNTVSLDGYFVDSKGDMSWAHQDNDAEWNEFVGSNASGDGCLLFGRVTYDMMAKYWPSPQAAAAMPVVAAGMNRTPKFVCSKTLESVSWQNTTLLKGNLATEVRTLKESPGGDLTILGSGNLISQLASAGLIDGYQFVVKPIVLGSGRTMFEGLKDRMKLRLATSRVFRNGNVVLSYEKAE